MSSDARDVLRLCFFNRWRPIELHCLTRELQNNVNMIQFFLKSNNNRYSTSRPTPVSARMSTVV
jgi:hypothetical protein